MVPTILFVDDEEGVLRALKRLFRKENADVLTAQSGPEGLGILEDRPVHVVVSDQRMTGMSGTEFLKQVRNRYPATVRCILSGYAEMDSVVAAINDGNVTRFIAKPWDDDELKAVLRECLDIAEGLAKDRRTRESLENKAFALQQESAQYAELLELQESLLRSSRDVLDHLPIAVAALDGLCRIIYMNRLFAGEFGHLPGAELGSLAGEPWRSAASDDKPGDTTLSIDDVGHPARTARVEIGGQPHTLIALSLPHASLVMEGTQ
ncbi:MAG: response regulator [Pseudomonadota bacterium]